MFKWGFQCKYVICGAVNMPLALQGASHHKLAGDINGVSVSASCDKHPNVHT